MSTDKKSVDWYNQNAQNYTSHVRNPDDSIYHSLYEKPAMYGLLPDLNGKAALSLGCGSGEDSRYLKNQGAQTSVGIDISEEMIKIAKQTPAGCEFKVMDMEKLDFPDNSFDFVYSSLAVHYIEDWTKLMQEVYRVLKPSGYFLFSCNHPVYSSLITTKEDEKHKVKQLAKIKNKTNNTVEIIGDYVNKKSISFINDQLAVTTWTKPFGEMSAEIKQAGFLVDNIVEPRPLPKMKKISPNDYETLTKIPNFVIFKLIKPIREHQA